MFIDIVPDGSSTPTTDGPIVEKKRIDSHRMLRQLNIERGAKILLLAVENDEDVSFLARRVSHQGELIVLDADIDTLNRIETRKRDGAYKSSKVTGEAIHTAFYPPERVDLPVSTAEFDGESLQFPDSYFDAVWVSCWGVETAVYPELIKQELYRVVRAGGLVAIY
ncbi:MAG: methyltransferase domain-containing protein [Chloroflexota bacterium]